MGKRERKTERNKKRGREREAEKEEEEAETEMSSCSAIFFSPASCFLSPATVSTQTWFHWKKDSDLEFGQRRESVL